VITHFDVQGPPSTKGIYQHMQITINTPTSKQYVVKMGRINVNIEDRVEERFRGAVFRSKGMKKGNLTQAIEEAMMMWAKKEEEKSSEEQV
jgi:hypothetical protein